MIDNSVTSLKLFGRRDMDMDTNIKALFNESDEYYHYPYFNDAKELFLFDLKSISWLIINKNKMNWETFNTSKIKTVYNLEFWNSENDFGTKIRYKCHLPIQRKTQTLGGELCMNWQFIDSFGVRLDLETIYHTDDYKPFYDDFPESWWTGEELLYSFHLF